MERNERTVRDHIQGHIQAMEAFGSRHTSMVGNRLAQEYLETRLREYGYGVQGSVAEFQGQAWVSPWTLKEGKSGPGSACVLLTAHFDSISQDPEGALLAQAPGADDNASGVAVVLEVARLLARQDLGLDVGFVFFNVEESGQHGSKKFAEDWKGQGARLDGVINVDTIGTWIKPLGAGGAVHFVTDGFSRPFLERIRACFGLPLQEAPTPWEDDHASFWAQGYAAIELTEDGCTPFMHTPQDTSEKIDLESVARVAEALADLLVDPRWVVEG